jgi:hypothetical protein
VAPIGEDRCRGSSREFACVCAGARRAPRPAAMLRRVRGKPITAALLAAAVV